MEQLHVLKGLLPEWPPFCENLTPVPCLGAMCFQYLALPDVGATQAIGFAHGSGKSNVASMLEREWMHMHQCVDHVNCQSIDGNQVHGSKCYTH
eukprot:2031571-Amphidinium_carterae.1